MSLLNDTEEIYGHYWFEFPEAQTNAFGIFARILQILFGIHGRFVVDHCSIAPSRKVDVGPLYPWRKLFEKYSVGYYPSLNNDNGRKAFNLALKFVSSFEDQHFIELLKIYGFRGSANGDLSTQNKSVLKAFRMRFYHDSENHNKLSELVEEKYPDVELEEPSYDDANAEDLSLREKVVVLALIFGYYDYKDEFLGYDKGFRENLRGFLGELDNGIGLQILKSL